MADPARFLSGRAALVTGSTDGIGYAVAEALARAGSRIMLHGLAPEAEMAARCAEMAQTHGVDVAYRREDIATEPGVAALIGAARAAFGTVDILVNNAVTRHFGPVETFTAAQWDQSLAVNVSAPFHAIRLVLPGMRHGGWGRIVNMTSVYGLRGTVNRADYATSKAALIGLTRAVAMEAIEAGITCNAVCPGSVSTPGTEGRVEQIMATEGLPRAAAVRRFLTGKQPSGRFVAAESVAAMVLFLCGEPGSDITGAVLPVEGGWLAS